MNEIATCATALAVLAIGLPLRHRLSVAPRTTTSQARRNSDVGRSRTRTAPRSALAVIGALVAVAVVGPFVTAAAFAGVLAWPRVRRLLDQRHRRAAIELAVPDAVELLVLVIRAGLTPRQAVEAMTRQGPAAVRPGFSAVIQRTERGQTLADALAALPDTLGPALITVADTLSIAERHGSPIGEALAQLTIEARQRRQRLAEADARKLPVRLSFPLVFCTLPSFVLVAIAPAVLAALSSLGDTLW